MERFLKLISALSLTLLANPVFASAFQLFEQDAASVGNFHAGYAAEANDASTSFYNPAGMVRLKEQEVVFGGDAITPSFKYVGDVTVSTIQAGRTPFGVTAQGGSFGFVPFVHYVAPLSECIAFGLSLDVPFGLKTNYGRTTFLRYVATLSSVTVVDLSPSLAFRFMDHASFGAGFDIQRMFGEFDSMGTLGGVLNTNAYNKADDTAYGYHLGLLYEFTDYARAGLSYHSQVVHHLSGSSKFIGPLADLFNDDVPINTKRTTTNVTLPPYTALSGYYNVAPCIAVMGSVVFTQWSTFNNLIINDVAGLDIPGPAPSTHIQVNIPAHYRNSWNVSLGADWGVSPYVTLRTGVGYDESPVKDAFRNVQLPDNDRYVIAFGGHYQITENVSADASWLHVFMNKASIHPPAQVTGAQTSITNGHVTGGADVLGAQIVWQMV